jgi:tetratricopeptide (TPR) repeat protein
MKNLICVWCFSLFVLLHSPLNVSAKSFSLINRIEGRVYDPNRNGVENIYVELLNEIDSVVARTKTNAVGRFTFSGVSAGRFNVRVLPFGTNFMEQTQEVYVTNLSQTANDTAYVDIYLRYEKRNTEPLIQTPPEVIFVQDIPPTAKKLYEQGVGELGGNQVAGMAKIEEAITIFPNYFAALNRLGKEYIALKNYEKSYPYLLRAIDINPRSYSSYYSLGYAFYQLKQYPAALEAAKATTLLVPNALEAQLLYGTVSRIQGDYIEAEKSLLAANTIAKKLNSEIHWQLALLYNRLNRTRDTITELETFLKLVPDTSEKDKIQKMIANLKASAKNKS